MSRLAGRYLKYKQNAGDPSWEHGVIYKGAEDDTMPFRSRYKNRCSAENVIAYSQWFNEVSEEEYNIQEGISYIPLIFN